MEHLTIKNQITKCKVSYSNYKEAEKNAKKFNSNTNNLGGKRLIVYRCSLCNKLHLGKSNRNITKAYQDTLKIQIYSEILNKVINKLELNINNEIKR